MASYAMVSTVRGMEQATFESVFWLLGGAGLAGIGIWLHNKYFGGSESIESWKDELQKELGIDRLKINKTLCFGTKSRRCPVHDEGQLLCKDLDCYFGPLGHMVDAINMAQKTLDVAIFSMSSAVIGDTILDVHRRGARVRVVADAESSCTSSSPMSQIKKSGIEVRQRISPHHMHHKFIIVDGEILINGSMNFSNSGAMCNWENVVVTSEPGMVVPFINEFQTLWEDFKQGNELIFSEVPTFLRNSNNRPAFKK